MSSTRTASDAWTRPAALVLAALSALSPLGAKAAVVALSGHVTSHLSGAPLADVRVSIGRVSSPFGNRQEIGVAYTDAEGLYAWTGDCESVFADCDVVVADPPYLVGTGFFQADAGVAVVDIALVTPSTVSGTVRFPGGLVATLAVEADHFIPEAGVWESAGYTAVAPDGSFVIGGLSYDIYRFCTVRDQGGAVQQCFDHVEMSPFADETDATLVEIGEGDAQTGIDFDLVEGGTLSGTLYDGYLGIPLENVAAEITAYDAEGNWLLDAITEPTGVFHLHGLPDGTFYLGVNTGGPFADSVEFYPDVVCTIDVCPPPTTGTPLTISGANEIDGLDFTVHPEVVVSGHVTEAETGAGIGGVDVGLYDFDGHGLTTSAAGTGAYLFYWYADKAFNVGAFGMPPRIDTVYPDARCLASYCVGSIVPINARSGDVLSNMDLPMPLGAVVSGHVAREGGSVPGDAVITLYDSAYAPIWSGDSTDGTYTIDAWLPGTYYVEAIGTYALSGCAFYLDRPCPDDGGSPGDVDPTPVIVTAGETRSDVDFHLPPADPIFAWGFDF